MLMITHPTDGCPICGEPYSTLDYATRFPVLWPNCECHPRTAEWRKSFDWEIGDWKEVT